MTLTMSGLHRMAQERATRKKSSAHVETEVTETKTVGSKEALKADLDKLLDEVDGVLEENAEEFVKGYVQKGGE